MSRAILRAATALGLIVFATTPAAAESLRGALAKAYSYNQDLNAARAQLRATDENVPQARAGMRPFITGDVSTTFSRTNRLTGDDTRDRQPNTRTEIQQLTSGITLNQTLFDGFQTPNNVAAAQAQVRASQFNLTNSVQNTLLDAATAYMNVLRDRQIASLRRQNLAFLREQVRASRARFEVGEGTRTDVAQSESERALATALLNSALASVAASEATYFDVVGVAPGDLQPASAPSAVIPQSVASAFEIAQRNHPAIAATLSAVDAAAFQVKSAEGALLPELSLTARVQNQYSTNRTTVIGDPIPGTGGQAGQRIGGSTLPGVRETSQNDFQTTIGAELSIPLYQGGQASSLVRQAKETLGQRRIEVDGTRDQVRASVAQAWAQLEAAQANITGYTAQVRAAELALNGVVEERNVGQRTTLDVLNAQADVISAQILLVGSERDAVVNGYLLVSTLGRLTADDLDLSVTEYNPNDHYVEVEDAWFGLRTPDGR